ncbi:MAG: helicase-related protein [Chloroflexi bacterium]|nr:helicase-related protein [Chloroflexota bacterium]
MAQVTASQVPDSASVRDYLTYALRLDLIGPRQEDVALANERIDHAPSRWYLTGFLVPSGAPESQRAHDAEEEFDVAEDSAQGSDDSSAPERGSGKRNFLPSSMGMSILVTEDTARLDVSVSWGDYRPDPEKDAESEPINSESGSDGGDELEGSRRRFAPWARTPKSGEVPINLSGFGAGSQATYPIDGSGGLEIVCWVRPTNVPTIEGPISGKAVSIFVVNRRNADTEDDLQDTRFAFQVDMTVEADHPLIERADVHGFDSEDWDERLADLHFRDVVEYAVGHNVSTTAQIVDGKCRRVSTEWMPKATVDRTVPAEISDVEFNMEKLGNLPDGATAKQWLDPLVDQYRDWINGQSVAANQLTGRRHEVALELVDGATRAANRIQAGIDLLSDPEVLDAFKVSNRAMAAAGRRRRAQEHPGKISPADVDPPAWRPFQLAYILMNLRGIADPTHVEREFVDLLFFPTGGGKTEAYLGLAAFTMVLRRLRNPESAYRGLSVLMRYTLRLLTLDQLGRAAAVICALELEREQDPGRLGEWPFEIALWVGRAATPNYMGRRGDNSGGSARIKTLRYAQDSSREPPIPLEQCPWCGERFKQNSFQLDPNTNQPTNLWVYCVNRDCDFTTRRDRHLPIVAVDEPIYQRLPAFMIATADKFAALPWTGDTARFFRGVDASHPQPPDLIIQDELHLISGPLGTMAGLYETAIDHLSSRVVDGQTVRPKVIASTATVRLARKQVRALFGRTNTEVFPAPGVDRRYSFFARQIVDEPHTARAYVGLAAQGRGPKVIFLRCMTTLMAAAQAAWNAAGSANPNPADPYMTAVAYFNALRELGSARRIAEDEINSRLLTYSERKRLGETEGLFDNRSISLEPVELTSRVDTAKVADAKRKLALSNAQDEKVDVALATNMISVGLDITRLGLMLVSGQPKANAEYIQATSRVGRDPQRPGLVVTLLNIHKPRDRSHYERFANYHDSFYRSVEATSVTPFSSGAMDRALPAVAVALARLGIPTLTPSQSARDVEQYGSETQEIAAAVADRAHNHADLVPPADVAYVRNRVQSLIDDWATLAHEAAQGGITFGYARRDDGVSTPLLREMIDPDRHILNDRQLLFRAPRSLRDVEPSVLLAIKTPQGDDLP